MRITHIIFDLDGTLIDTVKATFEACRVTADELGFPRLTKETLRDAMGLPGLDYFRKCMPGTDKDRLQEFARRAEAREDAIIQRLGKTVLFDGIGEMLKECFNSGVGLFIASTGSLEHVSTALGAAEIRDYFTGIYCDHPDKAESIGRIGKPDKGEKWIMVGDKRIDANAARCHGIFSVGAGWGYCDSGEKEFFDKIVFSPKELLEFVRIAGT